MGRPAQLVKADVGEGMELEHWLAVPTSRDCRRLAVVDPQVQLAAGAVVEPFAQQLAALVVRAPEPTKKKKFASVDDFPTGRLPIVTGSHRCFCEGRCCPLREPLRSSGGLQ